MTSERIKEIQEQTAYPESRSVQQALFQVWNDCAQNIDYEENQATKTNTSLKGKANDKRAMAKAKV